MANYAFKVNPDGKVDYLYVAGKDIVKMSTPIETAEWHGRNCKITKKTLPGQPDEYCICSNGEYYFAGEWEATPKKTTRKK